MRSRPFPFRILPILAIARLVIPMGNAAEAPEAFDAAPYVARYNAKVGLQFEAITNPIANFNPVSSWRLKPGPHILTLRGREEGTRLEQIFIGRGGARPDSGQGIVLAAGAGKCQPPMRLEEKGGVHILIGGKSAGEATFEFSVESEGDYRFWGKAGGPDHRANSFFISIDGGGAFAWSVPVTREAKNVWVEMEDRGLDPFLPWSFWLTWGATSPLSSRRDLPALREAAMKLSDVMFDQMARKAKDVKPMQTMWFILELETAALWQQDPRTPRAVVSGILGRIRPYLDSCHARATNGDGWADNTPNILLQQAALLRLGAEIWKTEDPRAAALWAATAKARMNRALDLRQAGCTFGYSYGSGVDANYFIYDGNYLTRYALLEKDPRITAALKDMAVAAACATLSGQPVSLGSPWWKHTFTAYNRAGTIPESILVASRDPAYAWLVTLARKRFFTDENLKVPHDAFDGEIGNYYNLLTAGVSVAPRAPQPGGFFSVVENGPAFRQGGLLVAMPWRSWGESTCGAVFSTPDAVEAQICSVFLTAVSAPGSGKPSKSHFPDAYSVVEDLNPQPEARAVVIGGDFIAAATQFRPALGGPALPGLAGRENKSPWRRTDIHFADGSGFAGALSLEALEDNACTRVALWAHVSDDRKFDGREIRMKGGTIGLEERFAGQIKNLGKTWGYSMGYYPLDLLEVKVKDAAGSGFKKGERFATVVSMAVDGAKALSAVSREAVGVVLPVEIRMGGSPRALLLFNPSKAVVTWPAESGYTTASQTIGHGETRRLKLGPSFNLPAGSLTVLRPQ